MNTTYVARNVGVKLWEHMHAPVTPDDAISASLLVRLAWESTRTDVHGVALADFRGGEKYQAVRLTCYCGTVVASYGPADVNCADKALEKLEIHAEAASTYGHR